jgi:ATP-dependent protease ClpP protease subunit
MPRNRLRQLIAQNNGAGTPIQARRNQASPGIEVLIYDVIDASWGVSAQGFAKAIAGAGAEPLTIRVNSPGGDVFEGRAIASLIRAHQGPTSVIVDGLAASAASTIAVSAQSVSMALGSFLMIHQSWALAMDNAPGLRGLADLLEKVDSQIAADYAAKASISQQQALDWMAAETWFTAEEAVAAGLADAVLTADAQLQAHNLAAYDRVPQALVDRIAALQRPDQEQPDQAALRAAAERRLRLYERTAA